MFIQNVPSSKTVFKALFRADATVLWRQRRALIMTFMMPVIFVISWSGLIPEIGAIAVLAICISIGLPAVGLMSYPMSIARDRERGVFQRLRATPIPTWVIMASRLAAQLLIIVLMTIITYLAGHFVDKITIPFVNIILMVFAAMIGGASFLGLGQLVVGYIKSSEAVNSIVRLLYFPFAIVGAIAEVGLFGQVVKKVVEWSPFGTTKTILAWALGAGHFNSTIALAFAITIGYGLIFAAAGIRRFQWTVN